jgi:hypothetical protein
MRSCGAGCTLGDIIAEWAVFGLGATGRAVRLDGADDLRLLHRLAVNTWLIRAGIKEAM